MKNFVKAVVDDVRSGKHIDAYIAVLLALIVAVISLLGIASTSIAESVMLACVSWLILSSLGLQRELVRQSNLTKGLGGVFTENYVNNSAEFRQAFDSARSVYIAGYTQHRMIVSYSAQIQALCGSGGSLKIIMLDPAGKAVEQANKRSSSPSRTADSRFQHEAALARVLSIKEQFGNQCKLEVKLVDFLIPFTIFGFDWDQPERAKVFVWLMPFREPSQRRPGFVVRKLDDPHWFDYFQKQFLSVWNWDEANVPTESAHTISKR